MLHKLALYLKCNQSLKAFFKALDHRASFLFYILIAKHAKDFAFRFEWEKEDDLRVMSESLVSVSSVPGLNREKQPYSFSVTYKDLRGGVSFGRES